MFMVKVKHTVPWCNNTTCRTVLRMSTQLLSVWYSSFNTCQRADCMDTTGVELLFWWELPTGKGNAWAQFIECLFQLCMFDLVHSHATYSKKHIIWCNQWGVYMTLSPYQYHRLEYKVLILIHTKHIIIQTYFIQVNEAKLISLLHVCCITAFFHHKQNVYVGVLQKQHNPLPRDAFYEQSISNIAQRQQDKEINKITNVCLSVLFSLCCSVLPVRVIQEL